MTSVQEIFNRIQKSKKEAKDIKLIYRDALANSNALKDVTEEIKALREKKKKIEDGLKEDFRSEFDKLEVLKADIENDTMLLSDAALTQYIKGEGLEIRDEYENKYEPIFKVQFKKVG
jgi:hypothetical protein